MIGTSYQIMAVWAFAGGGTSNEITCASLDSRIGVFALYDGTKYNTSGGFPPGAGTMTIISVIANDRTGTLVYTPIGTDNVQNVFVHVYSDPTNLFI